MENIDLRIENTQLKLTIIQTQGALLEAQHREQSDILAGLMREKAAAEKAAQERVTDGADLSGIPVQ